MGVPYFRPTATCGLRGYAPVKLCFTFTTETVHYYMCAQSPWKLMYILPATYILYPHHQSQPQLITWPCWISQYLGTSTHATSLVIKGIAFACYTPCGSNKHSTITGTDENSGSAEERRRNVYMFVMDMERGRKQRVHDGSARKRLHYANALQFRLGARQIRNRES